MLTRIVVGFVLVVVLALLAGAVGGGDEIVLLDAPKGAWLADVRSDAGLQVIEERDGWRHVRLDGWMPAGAPAAERGEGAPPAGGASPPPAPSEGATTTAPAPTASPAPQGGGATVTGLLSPTPGMQPSSPGGNLVVQLVGDLDRVDAELRKQADTCRGELQQKDAAIAELEDLVRKALNSTTNFTDATHRYDRAKADLSAARRERAKRLEGCRNEADAILARFAVARVLSEPTGRFDFRGVAAGRYRVVATDHSEAGARAWSMDCTLKGLETILLDPRTMPPGPDPYAGLR